MASSVDQKRLKATKFPPEFDKKVDIEKVNIDLMKKWIANRITAILGDEDDIVVETCYNLIEQNQFPKIKEIQIQLTGFLSKDTAAFCKELWGLMLSAQENPNGVPRELLEAKKLELQREQLSKAAAEARRLEDKAQNAMIDSFRQNEHSDRPEHGRGGGRGFRGGDRGGRDRGRDTQRGHSRRDSRSPPRRRSPPPRRERDIYVPSSRGRGCRDRRDFSRERRRSLSNNRFTSPPPRRARRSPSSDRSRTPPRRRPRRSPSIGRSRSPPRRFRRSPPPRYRGRRQRAWSPSHDNRRLPRHTSRSVSPPVKSSSPALRLSASRSRTPPPRRRRSPSTSRSRSPIRERRRRHSSSGAESAGSQPNIKRRKQSFSSSRSRSPVESGTYARKTMRSISRTPDLK